MHISADFLGYSNVIDVSLFVLSYAGPNDRSHAILSNLVTAEAGFYILIFVI